VRETPVSGDQVAMNMRVLQLLGIAKGGEQQQGAILIAELLTVLERHVEETAFARLKFSVETSVNRALGDCQCELISRELIGVAAKHVTRQLIEQDDAS
jgi:hypothetical protein